MFDADTTVESKLSAGNVGFPRLGWRRGMVGESVSEFMHSSRIGLEARLATRLAARLPILLEGRVAGGVLSAVPGVDGNGETVLELSLLD